MESGRVIISAPNQDFKLHKSDRGREGKGQESSERRGNMGRQIAGHEEAGVGCQTGGHISGTCWMDT